MDGKSEASSTEPKSRAPRRVSPLLWLFLLVPLFGIVELGAHFFFSTRAPRPPDWERLRPLVAARYKSTSVVVVAPYWAEPMARWILGDALLPLRDVARPDTTRYPEAIEIATLGSRAPELAGWKLKSEEKQGPFMVRTLENPVPPTITYDFLDHLGPEAADVRIDGHGTSLACAFTTSAPVEAAGLGGPPAYPAFRFACPGQPAQVFIGATVIEDGEFHPRRCIWSHAPASGASIVTRYRNVPLGSKIRGYVGNGWVAERFETSPPHSLTVTVGTTKIGEIQHERGAFWQPFELSLGPLAHTKADVEFSVQSSQGGSPMCFEADSR